MLRIRREPSWSYAAVERTRWIYFIACPDRKRVKIGRADSLPVRLRAIQAMNPYPLILLGFVEERISRHFSSGFFERDLHDQFAGDRAHGEWFDLTDGIEQWINDNATVVGERLDYVLLSWAEAQKDIKAEEARANAIHQKRRATEKRNKESQSLHA